jgi:tetratricopeptide (TPR) repeat protein
LTVYDEIISILQALPEKDEGKIADTYYRVAEILNNQGKYDTALDTLKRTLKIYSEVYGRDSMSVAKTLVHLGSVYKNLDNVDRASGCFSEGIKIFRSNASGRDCNSEILMSQAMRELGSLYARLKMYDKAINLCTESLRIFKQYQSKVGDGSVADTCLSIAGILNDWGKVDQAVRFYEESLRFYEENFGSDSTELATCYYGIAIAQTKMGDSQAGLRSFGKALRIHRAEGDKTLDVANDLFQIGKIYDSYDQTSKAYQCFQECLKIRQANLSDDDLDLLATRRYVDTLRRKMGHIGPTRTTI